MTLLAGRIAIITGAGSGIGRAIALKFAQEGAKIVISDLNEEGGLQTNALIEKSGGSSMFVKSNAALVNDCETLVEQTLKRFGALHIAVNNAGIGGPIAPVGEYPVDGWDKVVAVNLSGVFYGMRYQIPAILKSGGGAIVNVASILGQVGFANSSAYVAAKHGVVGLSQNAALEYSAQGVRVNVIGPGFVKTPMIEDAMSEEATAGLVSLHPIGRLGEPTEIAELVLWLSSDKASFVTGAYYAIDGGYLAR